MSAVKKIDEFKATHATVWQWLETESPTSDFAASLKSAVTCYGALTERQLAAAEKLAIKRVIKVIEAPQAPAPIGAATEADLVALFDIGEIEIIADKPVTPDADALSDANLCKRLRAAAGKLPPKDDGFARSLCDSVERYGSATPKQRLWLEKLTTQAETGKIASDRIKTRVGDLTGIYGLFAKARKHLKAPAIVIGIAGQELRLKVASMNARVPGSIDVATNGGYGESIWFGRILASGEFEASPRVTTPAGLTDGLARFAAEPAKMASEYGKATGRCCFCNTPIGEGDDPRARAVGYGEICASHFGMSFPTKSEAQARTAGMFADAGK